MQNENSFPLDWLCENTAVAMNRNIIIILGCGRLLKGVEVSS